MDLVELRDKKLRTIKTPIILSINKKNVEKYYETVSSQLLENNFLFIKKSETKFQDHFIFDQKKVDLTFNELKKKLKKNFSNLEFQENAWYLEWIEDTDLEVYPNEENEEVFDCYEIKVSFEPVQVSMFASLNFNNHHFLPQ